MIKYIVHTYTGYCGSDNYYALEMEDDHSEEDLDRIVWEMAVENADRYGYYPPDEDGNDDDDDESISNGIEGHAELYDPEKHDQHRPGGGSFAQDF